MLRVVGAGAAFVALALAPATQAWAAPQTPAEHYKSVAASQPGGCPSLADVDIQRLQADDWQDPPANFAFHSGMRLAAGAPWVSGNPEVLISWEGGHHERVGGSVIAIRGKDGLWQVDGVHTSQSLAPPPPGSAGPQPTTVRHDLWVLSEADGHRLDSLMASPCLRAEPRHFSYFHPLKGGGRFQCIGGAVTTVEVVRGRERLGSVQTCGNWGAFGEIQKVILAAAPKG